MIRRGLQRFAQKRARRLELARFEAAYGKYREFTMIPRRTFVKNLRLAAGVRDVPGCVVECGVWRGGMIAALADLLGPDRSYCLFDSFEGLPPFEPPEPIAVLRLDADWYDSTLTCLRALMPHLADGGLVIVDDYHVWDGCAGAVHAYPAAESLPYRIEQAEGDVCFIRKR